jgi:membrane protease YdiL (CAAX protease family)
LAFALVNPFGEEIIARAFTQREMEDLTGHGPRVGALISVLLQAAYHLYQGVVYAVGVGASFAVYAAYFARRRRVAPIIVAHLITDVAAVLITAARYRH